MQGNRNSLLCVQNLFFFYSTNQTHFLCYNSLLPSENDLKPQPAVPGRKPGFLHCSLSHASELEGGEWKFLIF